MAEKKKYYDISNILATDSQYNLLLGQRSNGKSYQAKLLAVKDAMKGKRFVYLRRWDKDIKTQQVVDYFADVPLSKITKKYDEFFASKGYVYLINRDREGMIKDRYVLGRYCALNLYERYKSQVFTDVENIIYEEFITDKLYLNDEPRLLQQFVSTVFRLKRGHVWLIGNTLSRVCPYFSEWSLEGVLKQKQGTIELYHYKTNDGNVVQIAVERCASTNNKNEMFFGVASKQIVSGDWDVKEYPKLPKRQWEYDKIYEVLIKFQSFSFVMELLIEPINGGRILFVYPRTKETRKIYRILQEEFSDQPNISSKLDSSKRPEQLIAECIKLNKVCFSDNLTGSDFNKCLELLKI